MPPALCNYRLNKDLLSALITRVSAFRYGLIKKDAGGIGDYMFLFMAHCNALLI